ncbi:hypothetical protein V501_05525 [Pseudogymnoascus sp. VKM F-4519 (FW-2642)]|nr:hypothetical protein V501_05525 [Pseudogymnoascus sp. VKM F-4519 (FW-2642)]
MLTPLTRYPTGYPAVTPLIPSIAHPNNSPLIVGFQTTAWRRLVKAKCATKAKCAISADADAYRMYASATTTNAITPFMTLIMSSNDVQKAIDFLNENPSENSATAARILHVNQTTLRMRRTRQTQQQPKIRGGSNKVLSDIQAEAIQRYIQRSYENGYGATKPMVFNAVCQLLAANNPPRKPPSQRWFQTWIKSQHETFHTIKTRPIEAARVASHDVLAIKEWFHEFKDVCNQLDVTAADIYNFDEVGFRVGMSTGEHVLVPTAVKELYICSGPTANGPAQPRI